MNTYNILCKVNWDLIEGKDFPVDSRKEIVDSLLFPAESIDSGEWNAAHPEKPIYYFLNNIDLTINGVKPKTRLYFDNHYELEILRLLALWNYDNKMIDLMLKNTKERLLAANGGKFDTSNESIETSICALRFVTAAYPTDQKWISELVTHIRSGIDAKPGGKKRHSFSLFYYWLALTDVDIALAQPEIERYLGILLHTIMRSSSYNIAYDKKYNPINVYIVRNLVSRLEKYSYIKTIKGYEGKDGRFHFDF